MSSSLERLKALTSKLDEKIAQKRATTSSVNSSMPAPASVETKEYSDLQSTAQAPEKEPAAKRVARDEESESVRQDNIRRVKMLYEELKIYEKCPDFSTIFLYKAMNLSGIGLKEEDFAVVREGKYIQVIAITYEPDATGKKKAKNISLGCFGRGESIDPILKNKIIEFVLRWRYEKAFQNLAHYRDLLAKVETPQTLF
jgi:hypothetical protein